jgi:TP901 family phage tail tape measure protein
VADVNANINIDINASSALAQLRALESQISNFNNSVARSNAAAMQVQRGMVSSLQAQIEATGNFNTSIRTMQGSLDSLSTAFDKGTLSTRQYFRYAASQMPGLAKAFRGLGAEQAQMAALAEERVKRLQTRYVSLGKDVNGMQRMLAIQPKTLAAGYATDIALAEQRQQLFNRALQQGTTGLVNWGKNTQWAGRQLMVGFTVPLTIAAGAAAKFFMDLDKAGVAFRRVYGDMGTSTAETEKNLQAIQRLGEEYTKYGLAVSDVVDLGSRAAATGAMNEDLLAATEQTLRLATLGQTDYNTALDATISFQTAFQLNSQELAETINFLNAVENQTILTMEDMARAVPRVAPVIKGLGGDVSDLAVFMTALREGGVTAEQGANALKSGLASLINPTERASETLKEMGINIKAIVDANRGDLMGTVRAFGEALSALGEFERQQALEATFGKYQYARLGALFKNIARDGSQAARSMELAGMAVEDLASLADKELATVSESVTNQFLGAVERLKVAIAPIGEMFLQAMTPIIEVVTNIANKFNELPDTVKTVIAGIVGAVGLIAPAVLMGIGLIANGIGNGLKFILALRGGIRNLVGVLTGSTQSFQYQSSAALDAAAAMNALDGSSGALTSSLLMQEGAVNSLIGAYGNLAGAARAAASSMPRAFPAPVMAGGARIVRRAMGGVIPGTGNTDSVPALLTPGEFVMTKEATQQFGPVLQAMNAGAVQGFQQGGMAGSQSARSRALQLEFSHVMDRFELTIDDISNTMNKLADSGQKASGAYKELERVVKTGADPNRPGFYKERAFGYGNLGVMLPGDINNLLGQRGGAGAARGNVSSAVRSMGAGTASGLIDLLAQKGTVLDPADEKKFADAFYRNFADEIDKLPDEMLKDSNLEQPFRAAATKAASEVNDKFVQTVRSTIDESAKEMTAIVTESGQVRKGSGRKPIRRGVLSGTTSFLSRRGQRGAIFQRVTGATMQNVAMQRAQQMGMEATESVAAGAQTRSPSDATRKVGKDVGEGLVQGMNESAAEVKAAGENMGRAATGGVADAAKQGQLELFDEGLTPNLGQPEQMALFTDDDIAMANREAADARKKNNFAIRQNTDATQKNTLQVTESTSAERLEAQASRKNANLSATKTQAGATMRPSISTSGAFTPAGAAPVAGTGDESAALAAALLDQEREVESATKQTRGLKDRMTGLSRKMFGVSAAFTGLTIAGSFMGGQMGEVASSLMPLAFGMDAVAGLLPMMMNPVGIAVAAFAAVGGGLWFLNNQMNDVRARAQDFADSLTTSAAEVNKVAEYFGNESLVQRQQIVDIAERAGVKSKDVVAGMEFIGSDVGQEMARQFSASLEREGSAQSAENFANRLASMMMQGAIDFGQAKQVAAGLAQQLGQPEISAQIIGKLERIVGPDGKDITKTPLKIAAEITANEQQIVDNLVAPTTNAINKAMQMDGGTFAATALISPLAGIVTQLGIDIPYVTDISKNLMSFISDDFENATASAHTYGKAVGNSLRNAYDNLNSAIIRNEEIIENAKKKDRPELKQKALEEEAKIRDQIAQIQETAEQNFGKLVQQNAALSKEALDGMQVSLKEIYQDPAMQMILENIFGRTGGLDQEVRFNVLMNLQSGALNPMAVNSLFDLIGNDEQAAAALNLLVESRGLDATNEFILKNLQIGDEEVRKKILLQFVTESAGPGQSEQAAALAGFSEDARAQLEKQVADTEAVYNEAYDQYVAGTGQFMTLTAGQADALIAEYEAAADGAIEALLAFDAERRRILFDSPFANADGVIGPWLPENLAASSEEIQEYLLVVQDLASLNIKPKIDLSATKISKGDLEETTGVLREFAELPEEMQKTVNVDILQATANMEVFDIQWNKIGSFSALQKEIGVLDSFSSPMQAFGMTWAQFMALPNIYREIVVQYTLAVQRVEGEYRASQKAGIQLSPDALTGRLDSAAALAGQPVVPEIDIPGGGGTTTGGGDDGGGGGGGGGTPEKSGADLVKEMIEDLKQQLKLLGDYRKKNGEVVSGLADALRRAGAPEQLIADIISKGAEGIKIAKELLKDKAKKLKEVTSLMLEVTRLTFVEAQRAEAANLATQASSQMALANAGLNPAVVANMDPQQAQAVAAAYRAYQQAQRKADAAEDKSREKRKAAAKELAKTRKEWEMVTDAVNKNTAAQERNAIVQALLEARQEATNAQNKVAAGLALAGRGFSAEGIAGALEVEGAANQVVAYTNKIKDLEAEMKKLERKGEKNWTKEEKKRYRQLERQLKKVNGDYGELLRLLRQISREQSKGAIANATIGFAGQAMSARRQGRAQNILMGQGYSYDQASEIAGDEEAATAIVQAQNAVNRGEKKLNDLIKERSKYPVGSKKYRELSAQIRVARGELNEAKTAQDNLNTSIAQSVEEQRKLNWQSIVGGITAEIGKQQNAQKFLNMGISDQLVLSKLNGLSLEDQNYFLSLSVEEQQAFINLLEQSIPLLDKINQSFEEIENRQRLISIQNREAADAKHGERDALEESAQLIDDAARAKQKEIDATQDLIDVLQEANDDLQHQVSLYERQVELIQRQSDQLNRGLDIISEEEEKINKFYDDRLEALDKVQEANSRIAQQQQDQLNLAQALSTGDIFAAVGAAQQMRSNQAQFAADAARQTLEEAREKALENITVSVNGQLMKRKDIEEQIRKNEEQIYQINQLMLPLQDTIYANNLEIYRIQDTILEPLQDQLDLINKQREAIDENIRAWDRYYRWLEDNAVDPNTGIKFKDLAEIRESFSARMAPGVINEATGEAYTEDEAFAAAIAGRNIDEETQARLKAVLFRQDATDVITPENAEAAGEAAKKATPEVTKLKDEFIKVKNAIVSLVNPIKKSGKTVDKVVSDSIVPLQEEFTNAANIVEGNDDSLLAKFTNLNDFIVSSVYSAFDGLISRIDNATQAAQRLASALASIERNIVVTITTINTSSGPATAAYKGGMIKGYSVGGSVFGNGSRDSISARLTPGEFVVRKSMVDKYGLPLFEKINQGSFNPSYSVPRSESYSVPSQNASISSVTNAPVYNTYSVNINAETNASADEIANKAAMKIREMSNMSLRSARG